MITNKLKGVGVALVTPFDANGHVDFDGLATLLTWINKGGTHYWVLHGTTGETATTTPTEKKAILDCVVKHNVHQLPIVYGLGGNNTQAILHELEQGDYTAIDAILSVAPYYNKPSQKGLYAHYEAIADQAPVPIILYNVPSRTGVNLASDTVVALSKHPNIIGIKEASGDLTQCIAIAQHADPDFLLIAGDDMLTVPMMSIGAVGVIATLANVLPNQMHKMVEAFFKQDYQMAKTIQNRLLAFHQIIAKAGNPVGTKQLLAALHICKNYVRLPLYAGDLDSADQQEIEQLINSLIN